ncbi:formylmethanofuran dehydrogenase subunit B [Candidatus Bathyarchaeota archaeon]|nr:MAG: formylmethanofuran dehydrogenase subunit B [Candidatus Bathyarchaeota archaeon]
MMEVFKAVTCPVCACLCDDLEVTVDKGKIVDVKNGCAFSKSKLLNYNGKQRVLKPLIRKGNDFAEVSYDEAVKQAAKLLTEANYPLFYGWSMTSCEAIRVGIELAEEIGGVIDTTSTICHGPSTLGIQDVGLVSSTLGQVRHRADLIIYWGSNPLIAHPRHMERYTVFSKGRFQEKRKLVVVDVRETETAKKADLFIRIEPNKDFEVLQALRVLIRDDELDVEKVAGIPVATLEKLAEMMVECKFGALFFGSGLTMTEGKNRNVDAAISLIRDLNRITKFIIMPMRGHFNVTGADMVFTWQTGFPYAVDFSMGYPRYNPGETSAIDILLRQESDAALVVASDPVATLPRKAAEHLVKNPLIVVDPHMSATAKLADIVLPSTFVGIEAKGTAYRMDNVPLPLKKIVEPPTGILSDEDILSKILFEVRRLKENAS